MRNKETAYLAATGDGARPCSAKDASGPLPVKPAAKLNKKLPNYIQTQKAALQVRCCRAAFLWGGGSVNEVALVLELFDELAELFGEAVHGALEAGQQVERHDDGIR